MAWFDQYFVGYRRSLWNGAAVPQRPELNFTGNGVAVSDDPVNGVTNVAITAGASSQINLTLVNGTNNNVTTDGSQVQRIGGPTLPWILTGLNLNTSLKAGLRVTLVNVGPTLGAISFEDTGSTAAYRFSAIRGSVATTAIALLYLQPNGGSVDVVYDTTSNRVLVTGSGYTRKDYVDPLDFAAGNDGFTTLVNSSPAFKAAITAGSASAISGTARAAASLPVRIRPGMYWIFEPIVLDEPNLTDFGGLPGGDQNVSGAISPQGYRVQIRQYQYFGPMIAAIGQNSGTPTYQHYTTGGNDFWLLPFNSSQFPFISVSDTHAGNVNGQAAWRAEFLVNVPNGNGNIWALFSSAGRRGNESIASAFRIRLNSTGASGSPVNVQATLTTSVTGAVTITAGSLSPGAHWIYLSYDGSFFRMYIGDTSSVSFVSKIAATGTVVQKQWESVVLGNECEVWPDRCQFPAGPYQVGPVRMANTAVYTNEVTPYTPVANDTAFETTVGLNDNWLQTFMPSRTTGFAHGQFAIGWTGFQFAGSPAPTLVYSIIKGGSTQSQGIHIHDLGLSCFSNGIHAYLKPEMWIDHVAVGGGLSGITLENNCYTSVVDSCSINVGIYPTAPTCNSWCVGLIESGGIVRVSNIHAIGGTYAIVARIAAGHYSRIYAVAQGLGCFYANDFGSGNVGFITIDDGYFADEAGNITDATVFAANLGSLTVRGGSPQLIFSAANPLFKFDGVSNVLLDVAPWTYPASGGGLAIKTLSTTNAGTPTLPCYPIVVEKFLGTQSVTDATPWTDSASPVALTFPQLRGQTQTLNFASDADMVFGAGTPAVFNDAFYPILHITDTHPWLSTNRNVVLPFVTKGYRIEVFNDTTKTLTLKGPSGSGYGLTTGTRQVIESTGTDWVHVIPCT